ncbi:MAG: ABC transporter substrate-binding protein [Gammaproteobacteria bacterium]
MTQVSRRRRAAIAAMACLVIAAPAIGAAPRVMSLDYCADQYLLALADRSQIVALSPDALAAHSYHAEKARGIPTARASAEEIITLEPDLVLRLWGGGHRANDMPVRFGIPVVTLESGDNIAVARANVRRAARVIGQPQRGERLLADFDARLGKVSATYAATPIGERPTAVYITPSGYTTGSETLAHEVMQAAGLRNLIAAKAIRGWLPVPLEQLVLTPPDFFVAGFYDVQSNENANWSAARHRLLRDEMGNKPVVYIPGRLLACSAWFFIDAVEMIHSAAAKG